MAVRNGISEQEAAALVLQAGILGGDVRHGDLPAMAEAVELANRHGDAAAVLQAGVQGLATRQGLSHQEAAALALQGGVEGFLARREVTGKDQAARAIQAGMRDILTLIHAVLHADSRRL